LNLPALHAPEEENDFTPRKIIFRDVNTFSARLLRRGIA